MKQKHIFSSTIRERRGSGANSKTNALAKVFRRAVGAQRVAIIGYELFISVVKYDFAQLLFDLFVSEGWRAPPLR